MTCVQQVRLTIAYFLRGEGEAAEGGVSSAVLQLMVGCAQGGVSGSLQEVWVTKSRSRCNGAREDE